MIPSRPPPTFKDMSRWSPVLNDFVSKCLVKNPDARSTGTELLNVIFNFLPFFILPLLFHQHEFIRNAKDISILQQMIDEAREIQERNRSLIPSLTSSNGLLSKRPLGNDGTLTNNNHLEETIVPERPQPSLPNANTHRQDTETDTFQSSSCNTMIELSSESSDTMIINENGTETENDADSQQDTLKVDRAS